MHLAVAADVAIVVLQDNKPIIFKRFYECDEDPRDVYEVCTVQVLTYQSREKSNQSRPVTLSSAHTQIANRRDVACRDSVDIDP